MLLSMFYCYILQLKDGEFYIGYSSNLRARLKEHDRGGVTTTKFRRPLRLVFYAAFITQAKATSFERYLKSSSGFAFRRKRLIETIQSTASRLPKR